MRRAAIALLVAAAFAVAATPSVGGAPKRLVSQPAIFGDSMVPGGLAVYGGIFTDHKKCLRGRKVKIFARNGPSDEKLVDTTRSSKNGGWGGLGDFTGYFSIKARLVRKQVGHDTCTGGRTIKVI